MRRPSALPAAFMAALRHIALWHNFCFLRSLLGRAIGSGYAECMTTLHGASSPRRPSH
jgi:hypothetical protein